MIGDWLIIALVVGGVWGFWLWIGSVFDAVSDWRDSEREERKREGWL